MGPYQLVSEPPIPWSHGLRQGAPPEPPASSCWSSRQGFPEDPRQRIVEESLRSLEGTLLNLDHKLNMLDDWMKYRREVYPSYLPAAMEPPSSSMPDSYCYYSPQQQQYPMPPPPPSPDPYGCQPSPIPASYPLSYADPSSLTTWNHQQHPSAPLPQQWSTMSPHYPQHYTAMPMYLHQQSQSVPYVFDEMHIRGIRLQREVEAVGEETVISEKTDAVTNAQEDEVEGKISYAIGSHVDLKTCGDASMLKDDGTTKEMKMEVKKQVSSSACKSGQVEGSKVLTSTGFFEAPPAHKPEHSISCNFEENKYTASEIMETLPRSVSVDHVSPDHLKTKELKSAVQELYIDAKLKIGDDLAFHRKEVVGSDSESEDLARTSDLIVSRIDSLNALDFSKTKIDQRSELGLEDGELDVLEVARQVAIDYGEPFCSLHVCVSDSNKSMSGHSVTVREALCVSSTVRIGATTFECFGTPVDLVSFALSGALFSWSWSVLVVSGISNGSVSENDAITTAVFFGNKNNKGQGHPFTRENYLASPPLVVAYVLAGSVDIDIEKEPIRISRHGKTVYYRDIWKTTEGIIEVVLSGVLPDMFRSTYESSISKLLKQTIEEGLISSS